MLKIEVLRAGDGWELSFKRPSNGEIIARRSKDLGKAYKKLLKAAKNEGVNWIKEYNLSVPDNVKALSKSIKTEPLPKADEVTTARTKKAAANPAPTVAEKKTTKPVTKKKTTTASK